MAFSRGKSGADIAHCDGYAWNLRDKLGKGSYGDVYKGWNNSRTIETAVKVVRKDLFRQDPKAEQNLRREIDILFKLKNCEYVVHLYHVEDMKRSNAIVMVMELCECDLDHLLKVKPFQDNEITLLLYQLGEGMKALRAKNIVHRDLKPGNILIKYHPKTGKMMIKLADFGFARHFTDESMKPLDLTSLAGTPVFMAPEALKCVFNHGVEHYDDKVDLWSIGALLYKVIVGQCGFYAQLNHILHVLNKKGDAIAWEPSTAPNYGPTPKVKYIKELPPEIDDRLSAPYKQKMNQLLVSLLKLDPLERMTFSEFFDFVDDLMKSKVEVINLLHGSSFKFMMEPGMKLDHLLGDIQVATGVLAEHQIIFSAQSDIYLSYNSGISEGDFNIFMNRSGGSQGHAVLYFVPVNEVTDKLIEPDYGAVAKLYYCVEDRANCVNLITEHKYSDEIVHALSGLQKQMERQFSCIQEFRSFCTKQLEILYTKLGDTRQLAQQTIARATLANEWLSADVAVLDKGSSLDVKAVEEYVQKVEQVRRQKEEIEELVSELELHLQSCDDAIMQAPSLEIDDIIKNAQELTKLAKVLPKQRKDFIYQKCEELLGLCKGVIVSSSERAHKMLKQLYTALSSVWSVMERVGDVKIKREELETTLLASVPKWRSDLLTSVSVQTAPPLQQGLPYQSTYKQTQTTVSNQHELEMKIATLESENIALQRRLKEVADEALKPGSTVDTKRFTDPQDTENLVQKLKNFCISAKRVIDPTSPNKPPPSPNSERKALYPTLEGNESGYLMVTMPEPNSLGHLIPEASFHLTKLQEKLKSTVSSGVITGENQACVKITLFEHYQPGDIVLFHPVGNPPNNFQLNLLHFKKPKPYAFLHSECYPAFGFRVGRIADLVIARLTKPPVQVTFKDDPVAAKSVKEKDSATFYHIWAEPIGIDFERKSLKPTFHLSKGGGDDDKDKRKFSPITSNKRSFV